MAIDAGRVNRRPRKAGSSGSATPRTSSRSSAARRESVRVAVLADVHGTRPRSPPSWRTWREERVDADRLLRRTRPAGRSLAGGRAARTVDRGPHALRPGHSRPGRSATTGASVVCGSRRSTTRSARRWLQRLSDDVVLDVYGLGPTRSMYGSPRSDEECVSAMDTVGAWLRKFMAGVPERVRGHRPRPRGPTTGGSGTSCAAGRRGSPVRRQVRGTLGILGPRRPPARDAVRPRRWPPSSSARAASRRCRSTSRRCSSRSTRDEIITDAVEWVFAGSPSLALAAVRNVKRTSQWLPPDRSRRGSLFGTWPVSLASRTLGAGTNPESFEEQLGDRVTKRRKSHEQRRRRGDQRARPGAHPGARRRLGDDDPRRTDWARRTTAASASPSTRSTSRATPTSST